MREQQFVDRVIAEARENGFTIEIYREGLRQIDFGHKKLHDRHLQKLFPAALDQEANPPKLIDAVAPGRPCTHKPMREILQNLRESV